MAIHRFASLSLVLGGLLAAAGCHPQPSSAVDGGVLGRVVIYRNGVAFYERSAVVEDGRLTVHVPRDKVDDFLKSLTVVDRVTGRRLAVSIPRREADESFLTMTLETAERGRAEVLITYVTEAPAWKPSYRVVVGDKGKVMLEGWAVVDNTTSEDWQRVLVGVGASSAMAFRYDLWSVRRVERDLLAGEEKFAVAPPQGVSPYASDGGGTEELASLDGNEVRRGADGGAATSAGVANGGALTGVVTDTRTGERMVGATVVATSPAFAGTATALTDAQGLYRIEGLPAGVYVVTFYYADVTVKRAGVQVAVGKTTPVYQKLSWPGGGEVVSILDSAPVIDPSSTKQGITVDQSYTKNIPVPGRTFDAVLGQAAGSPRDGVGVSFNGSSSLESQYYVDGVNTTGGGAPSRPPPVQLGDEKLKATVARILKERKDVVVEVHGPLGGDRAAAARGQAVKNKLVDDGVAAARIRIATRLAPGEAERVRVLAVAPGAADPAKAPPSAGEARGGDAPVGESHFFADRPMTVRAGSSAMVAMVHGETPGGVVYLYDPLSARGDQRFAFKAVQVVNPTGDTLEPGPVTVYGDGRFIGEGITEPVPPRASVVVPFALDKQVVITRTGAEDDRIARLLTVAHGIATAEVQHRRTTSFAITSRLGEPTKVYLRHQLAEGWTLGEAPPIHTRAGDAELFEVALAPGESKTVTIAEATPVERTFELGGSEALGMMQVYLDDPTATSELKAQLTAVLLTQKAAAGLVDRIETLREQLAEYRARAGELHAQIVTLKAVRTGGELIGALGAKLTETSARIQKATLAVVEAQEQLMLTRVKFQDQVAELRLGDATARR
jgi:hypothetical protein